MMKGIGLFVLLLLATIFAMASISTSFAATTNPPAGAGGYQSITLQLGNYTSSRTGVAAFKAPTGMYVTGASAYARASSGTTPTLKVRQKNAGFTNWSTSVTAGTVAEGKLNATSAQRKIADESDVSYDLVIGGTSPVWQDLTIQLFYKRL